MGYTISYQDEKGNPKVCIVKDYPLSQAIEALQEELALMNDGDETKIFIWKESE